MSAYTADSVVIDDLDRVLIGLLRAEGRLTWRELGERIGLGASATAERVRRLESAGVILGYRAEVDLARLGIGLRAITEIRLSRRIDPERFEQMMVDTPEVQSAMHVTGAHDYVVMLACADVPRLDELLMQWRSEGGVEESSTRIVLNAIDLTS